MFYPVFRCIFVFFFFQAEDGIRDSSVTGVQTCALPISKQRKCKKRGTNIEQLDVWNSPDECLAELGTGKETVAMNDSVVEPFEKNESASHYDQPNGCGDEHLLAQRCRATACLPRCMSTGESVAGDE